MSRVLFAAAADDDTGASDLAGMFADAGVSAVLVLDVSDRAAVERWSAEATAVVFATGTRALPAPEAYTRTVEAVRLAKDLGARTIATKYCSTFDSTAEGNIGPSLDALLDETGEAFTIALPALPVNGRTTYFGYHFVKGRLLSDSPMRNHPLTPMTDPDLVHHLGRQTKRRVGLTPIEVVERGAAAIRAYWRELQAGGIAISIVDCLSEAHAAEICEAASELRVVSGGSAFGRHLPAAWHRRGWLADEDAAGLDRARLESGTGTLVVAGSCSVATTAQNEWLRRNGATVLELDPVRLVGDGSDGA